MASPVPSESNEASSVERNEVTLKSYLEDTSWLDRMCNDYVALLQMARELKRIHSLNKAHGDIKPENITIRKGKNGVVIQVLTLNLKASKSSNSLADDVSALGVVFIQYLVKSLSLNSGLTNETHLQRLADRNHWAVDVVRNMICEEPSQRLNIDQVVEKLAHPEVLLVPEVLEHRILSFPINKASGKDHRTVYRGRFSNREVAVKIIKISTQDIKSQEREIRNMMHLEHPNVLQLLYADKDEDFWRLALELCDGNLDQLCHDEPDLGELVINDRDGLVQMAKGLEYIHGQNLVHRDVKPDNILVKRSRSLIYKISGFRRSVNIAGTPSSDISGTSLLIPPEKQFCPMSDSDARGTKATDVFALGIVFHFFLPSSNGNRGNYPINLERFLKSDINIEVGKLNLVFSVNEPWAELIKDMTQRNPNSRPMLSGILHRLIFVSVDEMVSVRECYDDQRGNVYNCAFDQTGSRLACGLDGGTLALFQGDPDVPFDLWSRSFLRVSSHEEAPISIVAWNVDGTKIAAGFGDGTVVVWKRNEDQWVESFIPVTDKPVGCIKWSPYSPKMLAAGTIDGALEVWDVSSQASGTQHEPIWSVKVESSIEDIVWMNPQALVTRTFDGRIQLWKIGENSSTSQQVFRAEQVTGICWNGEDQHLAFCSRNGTITICELKEEGNIAVQRTLSVGFNPCYIGWYRSADKSVVALGGENRAAMLGVVGNSLEMSELQFNDEGQGTTVKDINFSPNGQYLAAFAYNLDRCKVTIWFTGSIPMTKVFERAITPNALLLCWSPTGKKLAVANSDGQVIVIKIPPDP